MRGPLPSKGQRDWEKTNSGGDQASQNVADTFSTWSERARPFIEIRLVFFVPVIKRQNTTQWRRRQRRKHLPERWFVYWTAQWTLNVYLLDWWPFSPWWATMISTRLIEIENSANYWRDQSYWIKWYILIRIIFNRDFYFYFARDRAITFSLRERKRWLLFGSKKKDGTERRYILTFESRCDSTWPSNYLCELCLMLYGVGVGLFVERAQQHPLRFLLFDRKCLSKMIGMYLRLQFQLPPHLVVELFLLRQ